jgi:exoribonuclease II
MRFRTLKRVVLFIVRSVTLPLRGQVNINMNMGYSFLVSKVRRVQSYSELTTRSKPHSRKLKQRLKLYTIVVYET